MCTQIVQYHVSSWNAEPNGRIAKTVRSFTIDPKCMTLTSGCGNFPAHLGKSTKTQRCTLESVQDFLIKLDMKPCLHVLKISIFYLNHVIIRHTKLMNNLFKVCKITYKVIFKHQKSTKSYWFFFCKEYMTRRSTFIDEIFLNFDFKLLCCLKNCSIIVSSVHNFGRSDDDII